jgi:hypothetical protein
MTNTQGEGLTLRELVMELRAEVRLVHTAVNEFKIDYTQRGERIKALEGKVEFINGMLKVGWVALGSVFTGLLGLAWAVFKKFLVDG